MSGDLIVRPLDLDTVTLEAGAHVDQTGMCLMEAVAYMAGEEWSDAPECASPVIAEFGRAWNDALDDTDRQMLVPYIPRIIGTRASDAVEEARAWMAADWLIRTYTPAWLRLAGLDGHADALAAADPVDGADALVAVRPAIYAAGVAAWDAAGVATWVAAWAAAGAAARVAARAAAWDAAWVAARDAAGVAAWAAARDALRPTVEALQVSALDLLDRMIDCEVTA